MFFWFKLRTKKQTFHFTAIKTKRSIKFAVEKGTKRLKSINAISIVFVLYAPERNKIQLCESKKILINFNVYVSEYILAVTVLLPHF